MNNNWTKILEEKNSVYSELLRKAQYAREDELDAPIVKPDDADYARACMQKSMALTQMARVARQDLTKWMLTDFKVVSVVMNTN